MQAFQQAMQNPQVQQQVGFTSGLGGGMPQPVPAGPVKPAPLGGGMPQGGTPGTIPFSQDRMMAAVMPPIQGYAPGLGGGMPPGMALQQQRMAAGGLPGFPGTNQPAPVRGGGGGGGRPHNAAYDNFGTRFPMI